MISIRVVLGCGCSVEAQALCPDVASVRGTVHDLLETLCTHLPEDSVCPSGRHSLIAEIEDELQFQDAVHSAPTNTPGSAVLARLGQFLDYGMQLNEAWNSLSADERQLAELELQRLRAFSSPDAVN